jgi:hypothetical protein
VTSGETSGTGGERVLFWRGLAAIVAAVGFFNLIDVFTVIDDLPGVDPIEPMIWNATSTIAFIPAAWVIWRAYRLAPPGEAPPWRLAGVHLAGALAMAAVHVPTFTLLRQVAYAAIGRDYGFGPIAEFVYEFRKDLLGYVLGVAVYWALDRLGRANLVPAQPASGASPTFDIRDGARVIRAEVREILAVTSAGNYVEFVLEDGRRPLMRASLTRMEGELAPLGFVRTHRSWLVNAARVRGLRPEASGDYRVTVGDVEAPVSRRFPQSLARLKAAPQSLARST